MLGVGTHPVLAIPLHNSQRECAFDCTGRKKRLCTGIVSRATVLIGRIIILCHPTNILNDYSVVVQVLNLDRRIFYAFPM